MSKKKDSIMQTTDFTNLPPIPMPKNEKKRLIQAEVNFEIYKAVEKEMVRRDLNIRETVEYSLKLFLAKTNPEIAKKLGII